MSLVGAVVGGIIGCVIGLVIVYALCDESVTMVIGLVTWPVWAPVALIAGVCYFVAIVFAGVIAAIVKNIKTNRKERENVCY